MTARTHAARAEALARAAVAADRVLAGAGLRIAAIEASGLRLEYVAVDAPPAPADRRAEDPVEAWFEDDDARADEGDQPRPQAAR